MSETSWTPSNQDFRTLCQERNLKPALEGPCFSITPKLLGSCYVDSREWLLSRCCPNVLCPDRCLRQQKAGSQATRTCPTSRQEIPVSEDLREHWTHFPFCHFPQLPPLYQVPEPGDPCLSWNQKDAYFPVSVDLLVNTGHGGDEELSSFVGKAMWVLWLYCRW